MSLMGRQVFSSHVILVYMMIVSILSLSLSLVDDYDGCRRCSQSLTLMVLHTFLLDAA